MASSDSVVYMAAMVMWARRRMKEDEGAERKEDDPVPGAANFCANGRGRLVRILNEICEPGAAESESGLPK
jgi:hypothetical protein